MELRKINPGLFVRQRHGWLLLAGFAGLIAGTTVRAGTELTLDAAMHHSPALPGEMLQLDLTVTNSGSVPRPDVTLTMEMPAGLAALAEAKFSGDCNSTACESGETITWLLGSLPAGAHRTLVVPAVVANAAVTGTVITFSPSVADGIGGSDSDSATVTVDSATRFDLAMSENRDPALPGETLTYKMTWGYAEDSAAVTQTALEFTLPSGTTFVAASDGGSSNGSVVSWSLGFLQPGDSGLREVSVMVDPGLSTPSVIGASAQLINVATPSETFTAQTDTVIASSSPLSLVVELNTNPGKPEEYVNFNAIVTNNDPFTRFGVTLTAQQPQDTRQLFESEFGGDCPSTACEATERIFWSLGDLPAGGSVSVDLPGRVNSDVTDGLLVNFFAAASDSLGAQARQADTLRVQDDAVYDISLSDSSDPVAPGEQLSYRVNFGYREDAAAVSNSTLLFALPPGTSFLAASDSGLESNGMVSWALGNLSPGQGGIRDVTLSLDGALPPTLEAWAEIQSVGSSVERARAEAATTVAATPPLALFIEANPQPARADELAQIQLIVTNNDPFTRFGVELTGRHPEDAKQRFESEFQGNCGSTACESNELVTWNIGDIPAGASRSVDYPLEFRSATIDGVLVNLYAAAQDDQGVQARASGTLRIQSDALYDLALSESSDPVSSADTLIYQITFGYRADATTVNSSQLSLRLPDGVSFVGASDGGIETNNSVAWSLGQLSPGDGGQRFVEVAVDGGLADATVLQAEALLQSASAPLEQARASASTVVVDNRPLSLLIEANPKPGKAGDMTSVQMIVSNNDSFSRFGVTLSGRFPQGVKQLFEERFAGMCSSTACEPGELITWDLGEIDGGGSRSVQLPAILSDSDIDGFLVNFFVQASEDQGFETQHADTIRVSSDNTYELALSESADPVLAGEAVNFDVVFGYSADASVVSESGLALNLPAGLTPLSASGNGVITGNTITWSLGPLSPGSGGLRRVTATVDPGLAAGALLESQAHVFSQADPLQGARAEAVSAVGLERPLLLTITSTPNPALAMDQLLVQYSVTNNDAFSRFGVTLVGRFPQGVNQLFETFFGGQCPSTACEPGEQITWTLGDIGAGQTVTVDLPPIVSDNVTNGDSIDFFAVVSDDTGVQASAVNTVRIGFPEIVVDFLFSDSFEGSD